MMTSTSLGGTIWLKWMLKPWANMRTLPAVSSAATSLRYSRACVSSGTSMMIMSARVAASAAVKTSKPAFWARSALAVPGRSETTT